MTNGTNITTRYYAGAFEYEGSSLKLIHNEEGRVRVDGTTFTYDYYLKDHLGNTMVCFTKGSNGQAQVLQSQSYYPFGMSFAAYESGGTTNRYLYNGKEMQNDLGLDWYDYGARFYDAAIGRWHSVDPSAETYYSWTPYNYCANDPMNIVDLDGMDWYQSDGKDGAVMWREGSNNVDGYKNLGAKYTQNLGGGVSISYTQNEATSMTFKGADESQFVQQSGGTGCAKACDKIVEKTGNEVSDKRINITNSDDNGVVTSANNNSIKGITEIDKTLENGNPVKVGVDYKSKQVNNLKEDGGDGMTDHFIVIASKTEKLNNGQVTSKVYNFFDPRSNKNNGTSKTNTLSIKKTC